MIGGAEFALEEAGFLLLGHVLAVVAGLVDQRVLVVLRGVVRLVHRPVGLRPGCGGLGVGRGAGARHPWVPRRRSPRLPWSWPPAAPPPTARCSSPPGCRSRRRSSC